MPDDDTQNILEQASNPAPTSFLSQYVGEGKKYKTEEDLAKAYANAEPHISNLTRDLNAVKTELEARKDFIVTALTEQAATERLLEIPTENPNAKPEDRIDPAAKPKVNENEEVDLNARIKQVLEDQNAETRASQNAKITQDVMIEKYGSKEEAVKAIQRRAEELDVSPQWLADSAFRSPAAFFASMGIDPRKASTSTPNSSSDVNQRKLAELNPGLKPDTYAYFQNIRKTNPGQYKSPAVQAALMKAAQENPNFFKS